MYNLIWTSWIVFYCLTGACSKPSTPTLCFLMQRCFQSEYPLKRTRDVDQEKKHVTVQYLEACLQLWAVACMMSDRCGCRRAPPCCHVFCDQSCLKSVEKFGTWCIGGSSLFSAELQKKKTEFLSAKL